jgi:hypothetical protein
MVRLKKEDSSVLHDHKSLENSISRVEQLLSSARRVATEMARLKIGQILISNQASFGCSLRDLGRWARACEDAWTDKLKDIGYFKAASGGSRAAIKKAVKAKKRK